MSLLQKRMMEQLLDLDTIGWVLLHNLHDEVFSNVGDIDI
jgi:hypothetical protein